MSSLLQISIVNRHMFFINPTTIINYTTISSIKHNCKILVTLLLITKKIFVQNHGTNIIF